MGQLSKTYEPAEIESHWYGQWESDGDFHADASSDRESYSIVIPPPNVTGVLTLGHVLNNTIQDILARRARMLGKEVLWLPGTDHAGIATQNVVEKSLRKSGEIKHRDDLGREQLVERIWDWKRHHGGIIIQQLRRLGASCDWARERFTMDADYSRCVQGVFVDLFNKGLIYRGKRMVNWCPSSLTALSDEEVVMKQQQGTMYHFQVEVVEAPGTWLVIATTRPETIPGDTAVAVNPKDARYAHLIGCHVRRPLPLEDQALLRIIGDEQVDYEFGTGVLKVTPAHDATDFAIGQRHGLEVIDIFHPHAVLNELAGTDLAGLDRTKARTRAVELLRESGALVKEEPYANSVGYSERADVPVEPRLSEQWFLKYPSREQARTVVAEGRMRFHPARWAKVYDHWMENLQDWCISRQLWWGHRIPVWYRDDEMRCQIDSPGADWVQDCDVLDTWFSSWLWPFATMGWPEKTPELKKFYPTSDLVTGPDIIFFWVARMIMAGYEWMGEMPFKNVYFTGIIRDKQGRKMSKSLGNSPDPLDLIDAYGADALRMGVMRSAPLGQDILFDEKNVELGRNFCTKLWNACRFRQMMDAEGVHPIEGEITPALLGTGDKWILLRLDRAIRELDEAFEAYRFSDAAAVLYRFFWTEFCDWYLESSKAALTGANDGRKANTLAVMDFVLGHTLRLFHPFMPFITEELWHGLGFHQDLPAEQGGRTIQFAHWPTPLGEDFLSHYGLDAGAEMMAERLHATVTAGRGLRRDAGVPASKRVRFVLVPTEATLSAEDTQELAVLLNAQPLEVLRHFDAPKGTPSTIAGLGELYLPLEGHVDLDAERVRLEKEIARVEVEIAKVRTKLSNENFTRNAPAKVIEEHRQRECDFVAAQEKLQATLADLAG